MSRPLTTLLLASALYAGPPGLWAQASGADPLVGTWVGELALGAVTVHIVFNVSDAGGSLSATMDSPDQGAKGIPVSAARDDRGSVSLEVKSIGGVYRGTLAGDASRVEGQWAQGGATEARLGSSSQAPSACCRATRKCKARSNAGFSAPRPSCSAWRNL